ncbi:hypothetical protein LS72_004045 [Helicobacter apodemus]|uniref:Prepilin-type N-terminal cleavage/methylation domain-containing protein n=2 Tax=Helicobacter apodemus TaxID=135569 RepID=A0A4U8UFC1_9HELI|nr:hypothetical protein LS72_004045 [Helicobacter apodemus]
MACFGDIFAPLGVTLTDESILMKFAPNSFRAFSLIELLMALSMVSFSFIFFVKVLLQEESSKAQSLKIPICDTLKKQCVYHLSANKSFPLINIQ